MRAVPVRSLVASTLLLALLAGCLQGTTIPDVPLPGAHGIAAGTAPGHGAPRVDTGQVEVTRDGSRWRATQTVTASNGFGGADRAAVSLASFNGGIGVAGSGDDSYRATVRLFGTGDSEQMARDALAAMRVDTPDGLAGTSLTFGVHVVAIAPIPMQASRGASIDLATPRGPIYGLGADTSNGGIDVDGLTMDQMTLDTSNGDVRLTSVAANQAVADTSNGAIVAHGLGVADGKLITSNGGIDVDGNADTLTLDTSNGAIDATLHPSHPGAYSASSSNGQARIHLSGDGSTGFDASADTSNGRATVQLTGAEAVGAQDATSQHQRTTGFAAKAIQTTVTISTSNADAAVIQD